MPILNLVIYTFCSCIQPLFVEVDFLFIYFIYLFIYLFISLSFIRTFIYLPTHLSFRLSLEL